MRNTRKLVALLLMAVMVLSLAACGKSETLPDTKSEAVGLYLSANGEEVVDKYNQTTDAYSVDKNGNIVNTNTGGVIVAKDNTAPYVPVTGLTVDNVNSVVFPVELSVSGTGDPQPRTIDLRVTLYPITATCREITLKSDNPAVAELPISAYTIATGSDSVTVSVSLKSAGYANLTVSSPTTEGSQYITTIGVSASVASTTLPDGTNPGTGADGTTNPGDPANPTAPNTSPTPAPTASPKPTTAPMPTGQGKTGYITGEGVNLREGPSTDYEVITSLAKGTKITVYATSGNWTHVMVNGRPGYVSSKYVSTTQPTAAPTEKPSSNDPYSDSTGSGGNSGNSGGSSGNSGSNDDGYSDNSDDVIVVIPSE